MALLVTSIDGETFISFTRRPLVRSKRKNHIYEVQCSLPRVEKRKKSPASPGAEKPKEHVKEQVELPAVPARPSKCPGWPVEMDSDCWTGVDPVCQVFRSHVVAMYLQQEELHRKMADYRKEKRSERSAECRQLAQRFRTRSAAKQRRVPGPKIVIEEKDAPEEEVPLSPQAPTESLEEAAKPMLSPRLARFEQRCAARRRAGGLVQSIDLQALLKARRPSSGYHSGTSSEDESHDGRRPASSPQASQDSPRTAQSWEMCLQLSRKHKVPLPEVRMLLAEFNQLEGSGPIGELTHKEFEEAVRPKANIPADRAVPEYLLMKQYASADKDDNGLIDFEEFLLWSRNALWLEELAVPSQEERELRKIARKYGLNLTEIDSIKRSFDKFDLDGSGQIDRNEFRDVVCNLMKVKTEDISQQQLDRYWIEASQRKNESEGINFEEFLDWTMRLGIM